MKALKSMIKVVALAGAMIMFTPVDMQAAETAVAKGFNQDKPIKIAVVNFKTCVEKSKLGKQEQANFEAMKKQMDTILEEKEKTLNEMATKLNDVDYLDSLSPEAETELKRKFRALGQEASQQQAQYYQALSQSNLKIIQKITDEITEAAKQVAKKHNIDLVINEDSIFFNADSLDISMLIVSILDENFDKAAKETKPGA